MNNFLEKEKETKSLIDSNQIEENEEEREEFEDKETQTKLELVLEKNSRLLKQS